MYKISVDFLKWLPSRDREVTSNSAQLDTMTSSVIVGLGQEWDPSQFWFLKWDQLEISQENLKKSRQIKSLIGIMRFQTDLAVFRNTQKVLNYVILIFVLIGTGRCLLYTSDAADE